MNQRTRQIAARHSPVGLNLRAFSFRPSKDVIITEPCIRIGSKVAPYFALGVLKCSAHSFPLIGLLRLCIQSKENKETDGIDGSAIYGSLPRSPGYLMQREVPLDRVLLHQNASLIDLDCCRFRNNFSESALLKMPVLEMAQLRLQSSNAYQHSSHCPYWSSSGMTVINLTN